MINKGFKTHPLYLYYYYYQRYNLTQKYKIFPRNVKKKRYLTSFDIKVYKLSFQYHNFVIK